MVGVDILSTGDNLSNVPAKAGCHEYFVLIREGVLERSVYLILLTVTFASCIITCEKNEGLGRTYIMVKIRLRRTGAKHKPMYRVVVTDSRSPREGAFIEVIGNFNPLEDPEVINIDTEKALSWLEKGAQPTETAYRLLAKTGVMDKFKQAHPARKFKQAVQKTTQRKKRKADKSTTEVKSP